MAERLPRPWLRSEVVDTLYDVFVKVCVQTTIPSAIASMTSRTAL
jgi:hypothetical protein